MSPVNLTTSAWQASQPNQQSAGPKICQAIAFRGDYILSDLSSQVNQNSQTRVPMYTISGPAISVLVLSLYIWREFYYMALFRNNKPKRLWAASLTTKGSHHWGYFTVSTEEKKAQGLSESYGKETSGKSWSRELGTTHMPTGPHFSARRLTHVSKQRNVSAIHSQMKQNTKENSTEDVVDRMPVSTVLFHSQQE